MAKRKPREIDRREIGMFIGKGKGGPYVHLLYEVRYSDGTEKVERGHSVFAWAGLRDCNPWMMKSKDEKELQKKLYRPDLSAVMDMMVIGYERMESACLHADRHKKETRKKGKKRGK